MTTPADPPTKLTEFVRGWRVLVACTIGIAAGITAIPFYTNALFFPKLHDEFGWSQAALSLVVLVYTLVNALLMPVIGRIVDQFGTRGPAAVSGLALAAGYLGMSIAQNYAVYFAVSLATMTLAIGTGPIGYSRTIYHAFDRMRGLAFGIVLAGSGVTAVVAPQLLGPVIAAAGWRAGYRWLALAVLVLSIIVVALMPARDASASRAGLPGGGAAHAAKAPVREILADRVFRQLTLAFVCMALAVSGLVIYLYPMMLAAGVSESSALWAQSSIGVSVIVGRLASGYLFDRFFAPYVAAGIMTMVAIGLATIIVGGPSLALAAAVSVGFCLGAEVDMVALLISRYFHLSVFGQVYGFTYIGFALGLAVSPYMLGLIVDNTAGFVPVVATSVVLLLLTAVLFALLPRYGAPRLDVTAQRPSPVVPSAE